MVIYERFSGDEPRKCRGSFSQKEAQEMPALPLSLFVLADV
jgi:hypothetical protein